MTRVSRLPLTILANSTGMGGPSRCQRDCSPNSGGRNERTPTDYRYLHTYFVAVAEDG
jgi:hypothetical protein